MENIPFHLRPKAAIATLQNCWVIFFLCLTISSFGIWKFPSNHQLTSHEMQPNIKANLKTHYEYSWHSYLPHYFFLWREGTYTHLCLFLVLGLYFHPQTILKTQAFGRLTHKDGLIYQSIKALNSVEIFFFKLAPFAYKTKGCTKGTAT